MNLADRDLSSSEMKSFSTNPNDWRTTNTWNFSSTSSPSSSTRFQVRVFLTGTLETMPPLSLRIDTSRSLMSVLSIICAYKVVRSTPDKQSPRPHRASRGLLWKKAGTNPAKAPVNPGGYSVAGTTSISPEIWTPILEVTTELPWKSNGYEFINPSKTIHERSAGRSNTKTPLSTGSSSESGTEGSVPASMADSWRNPTAQCRCLPIRFHSCICTWTSFSGSNWMVKLAVPGVERPAS